MDSLLGSLVLRPGRRPALQRLGPTGLATALMQGRPAAELPERMAALHALCAHGHRLAAGLALRAAQGEATLPDSATRQALQLATAAEQMRRIALDWPRWLAPGTAEALPLAGAPPWQSQGNTAERLAALPGWLEQHWLGQPLPALREALAEDPAAAALRWSLRRATPLARWLAQQLPPALALATGSAPLRLAADGALDLTTPRETGPWTRHHEPHARPAHNAGMRLATRLLDLLRLASPEGLHWLHLGAVSTGPGTGRAWVELGRGLLHYELRLAAPGTGPQQLQSLRVVSPTDWNFAAGGPLDEALAGQPTGSHEAARRLAVAFDPCVPFSVETTSPAAEPAHA